MIVMDSYSTKKTSYVVPAAAVLVGGGIVAYMMMRPKKASASTMPLSNASPVASLGSNYKFNLSGDKQKATPFIPYNARPSISTMLGNDVAYLMALRDKKPLQAVFPIRNVSQTSSPDDVLPLSETYVVGDVLTCSGDQFSKGVTSGPDEYLVRVSQIFCFQGSLEPVFVDAEAFGISYGSTYQVSSKNLKYLFEMPVRTGLAPSGFFGFRRPLPDPINLNSPDPYSTPMVLELNDEEGKNFLDNYLPAARSELKKGVVFSEAQKAFSSGSIGAVYRFDADFVNPKNSKKGKAVLELLGVGKDPSGAYLYGLIKEYLDLPIYPGVVKVPLEAAYSLRLE